MDAAFWQGIADWAAAHALWVAGAAALTSFAGAFALRLRRSRPPAPAPIDLAAPSPPAAAVAPPEAAAPPRLQDRLRRTGDALVGGLGKFLGGRVDDALLDQLEEQLLHADLGVKTATALLDRVRREGRGRDASTVREILREAIAEKLRRVESRAGLALAGKPHV